MHQSSDVPVYFRAKLSPVLVLSTPERRPGWVYLVFDHIPRWWERESNRERSPIPVLTGPDVCGAVYELKTQKCVNINRLIHHDHSCSVRTIRTLRLREKFRNLMEFYHVTNLYVFFNKTIFLYWVTNPQFHHGNSFLML